MAANNQLNLGNTPLPVEKGGFGTSSHVAYAPLTGGTTSTGAVQSVASAGVANQLLLSGGAGALPAYGNADWQFFEKQQANAVASANFINLSSNYIAYKFILNYLNPVTDGVSLYSRVSIDNGATWISAASSYAYRLKSIAATATDASSTAATQMQLSSTTGNTNFTEFYSGEVTLMYPMNASTYSSLISRGLNVNSSGTLENTVSFGQRLNAEANNGIQFFFSSGNLASVDICMYGLKRT